MDSKPKKERREMLPTEDKELMTHIFLKPCGCLACAIVNVPEMFGELSKAQNYAKRHNEVYKLMETQAVREMAWKCPEHKNKQEKLADV